MFSVRVPSRRAVNVSRRGSLLLLEGKEMYCNSKDNKGENVTKHIKTEAHKMLLFEIPHYSFEELFPHKRVSCA